MLFECRQCIVYWRLCSNVQQLQLTSAGAH
jgi:hypothetical protein